MISMKDYVEKIKADVIENQKPMEYEDFDGKAALEDGLCPFCKNDEFDIMIRNTEEGKILIHYCIECEKSWFVEFNFKDDTISGGPIDIPPPIDK